MPHAARGCHSRVVKGAEAVLTNTWFASQSISGTSHLLAAKELANVRMMNSADDESSVSSWALQLLHAALLPTIITSSKRDSSS